MIEFEKLPFIASFLAGIMTFISPCILPLIPAYITFISGVSLDELKSGTKSPQSTFLNAVLFVLGFSLVFIILGASATYLGNLLLEKKDIIRWVGGIIIIIFGFHILGITRIKFLYKEKKIQLKKVPLGYFGSFLVGLTFAIAWTPCVGPILSSILIVASAQETVSKGVLLLLVYSAGLGIPFLITALFINWALQLFTKIKKFYKFIEIFSGIILIIIGVLMITDSFKIITGYLLTIGG